MVNRVIRTLIRFALKKHNRYSWLANRFRVYGVVPLQINSAKVKMYAEGDDFIVNELYYELNYEKGEFRLTQELCRHSNFFIDVGANTGIFSVYAKVTKPDLHVIALEPHPGNFQRLLKNAALNNVDIDCRQLAAGDENRNIHFTVPADGSIATTASANNDFAQNFKAVQHWQIEVAQVTLDSVLGDLPLSSADVLKIDVEYYELEVLHGLRQTLLCVKPFVILEILNYDSLIKQFPGMTGGISPSHSKNIHLLMSSVGYTAYEVREEGLRPTRQGQQAVGRNFLFAPVRIEHGIPWGKVYEFLFQSAKVS